MNRINLYNKITPCGSLDYASMVWLINNLIYTDQQIGQTLLIRLSQTGKLKQEDWILLFNSILFLENAPIDANTAKSWLVGKCKLSREELKLLLEYSQFHETEPTFLLTSTGDILTSNNY